MKSESQINLITTLLRLLLIEEMLEHGEAIMETFVVPNDVELLSDLVNLLESALFSFSWGDHLSLQLLASALDRRIIIYSGDFAPNNARGYFVGTQEKPNGTARLSLYSIMSIITCICSLQPRRDGILLFLLVIRQFVHGFNLLVLFRNIVNVHYCL